MHAYSFNAPWGTWVKVGTGLSTAILAVPIYMASRLPVPGWLSVVLVGIPVATVLICALYTVRGYELTGLTLVIRRLLWESHVELSDLVSVDANPVAMRRSLRLFGNGGLFSVSGWFWNRDLGRFRAYVMDSTRAVVLKFEDRTVVISPDRPEEFVRVVRELRGWQ